jgi:transcriptional regulator with XRE-family HTH domain
MSPGPHDVFRDRLGQVVARSGLAPAAFARAAGLDRSTLSQLLAGAMPRLPRAETLAAIARAAHVSVDWLLGLSQREEPGAEIIEAVLQVEPYGRIPAGDTFLAWLREAQGSRICTVPIGLPDFLKLDAVLEEEYPPGAAGKPGTAAESVRRRLALMRHPQHQLELCVARESLEIFARGIGRWGRLDPALRRRQLRHMAALADELYPAVRMHLYDATSCYSAHYTVFGARRVAVFLGASWLVLSAAQHIEMFIQRFGDLVRQAVVQPHEVARYLEGLAAEIAYRYDCNHSNSSSS